MTKQQNTQLDFSKYQTADLIATISEIVSLPGAITSIAKWAAFGVAVLVFVAALFLKVTGNFSFFWMVMFELYATPAGSLVGVSLGIAEFIRRSLNNMTKLIDLLLVTTMQVAIDAQGLASGETEMPSTRDLVEDVYQHVILVLTKEALQSMLGIFGKPVYWLYHVTLNQMVRVMIKLIPNAKEMPSEVPLELPAAIDVDSQTAAETTDEQGQTVASLLWAQKKFADIGGRVKLLVMIPCYAIVGTVIGLILFPPVLIWWLFLAE